MHYSRWKAHGDPLVTKPLRRVDKPCSVEGCEKPWLARDLCDKHYYRWRKYGDPLIGEFTPAQPPRQVVCEWCGGTFKTRDKRRRFCDKRCSSASVNSRHPRRRLDARGYVHLWMPEHPNAGKSGYILEHRYIMAELLGRSLRGDEVVHHKNEITGDNRTENLELMTPDEHSSLHNKGVPCRNPFRDPVTGRFASE